MSALDHSGLLGCNLEEPRRCPKCRTTTINDPEPLKLLSCASVTCHHCRSKFTRWPYFAVFIHRGVVYNG